MKLSNSATYVGWVLALLCVVGCSTVPQLGSGERRLAVGKRYVLKRDAILLEHRGTIDSIENPDYKIKNYKPYKNYDPYYTAPRGVLPAGTVLEVKKIRVFNGGYYDVEGEILSGKYKRQPVNAYNVAKTFAGSEWPLSGRVTMEKLCGGESFDPSKLVLNVSRIPE